VDEEVAPPDSRQQVGRRTIQERPSRHGAPRTVLQLGTVHRREPHQGIEPERRTPGIDVVRRDLQLTCEHVENLRRCLGSDLKPDDRAEATLGELELEGFEKVVGVVRKSEVGVACDPEERESLDLPAEHAVEEVDDRVFE
jgi:hypothetical protein